MQNAGSYRCGEDGLEAWVERRSRVLPFIWHKRWAVLQPRSSSQPAILLFYKKSVDSRPEMMLSLEGMAVLPVNGRGKLAFKLAHPRREPVYVAVSTKKCLAAWMVAIMEEIEEGSSSRLGYHVAPSRERENTVSDKDLAGEWTLVDDDDDYEDGGRGNKTEDGVPNNSGLEDLAETEFAVRRLEHLYARYSQATGKERGDSYDSEDEDGGGDRGDGIRGAGIELMCRDVGADPDDPRVMALTWRLAAKNMGMFTRDEFFSGLQALKVDSVPKLRDLFERQLPMDLKNTDTLQEIWRFAFNYAKAENSKVIDLATAEVLMTLLLSPPIHDYPHVQPFLDFLVQQTSCKMLNIDQWANLLDFLMGTNADLSNYDEEAAWPVLFDEYVEWARGRDRQ